jgi:hypothetical protein
LRGKSRALGVTAATGSSWSRCVAWSTRCSSTMETLYAPRQGNDRLLLGLKGSLNEYDSVLHGWAG